MKSFEEKIEKQVLTDIEDNGLKANCQDIKSLKYMAVMIMQNLTNEAFVAKISGLILD